MPLTLVRIDDRLVHGQIATQWTQFSKAQKIVIVDDPTAKDSFLSNMFKKLAPMGTTVELYTTEDCIEPIKKYVADPSTNVMILVKTPAPILAMLQNGIEIKQYILGGMGSKMGRKTLYRNICANSEECEDMKKINALGCMGYVQIIPSDKQTKVMDYIK